VDRGLRWTGVDRGLQWIRVKHCIEDFEV